MCLVLFNEECAASAPRTHRHKPDMLAHFWREYIAYLKSRQESWVVHFGMHLRPQVFLSKASKSRQEPLQILLGIR